MNEKNTKQRELILSLLRSTKTHPTANWLYNELKDNGINIGLATIYRNLNRFQEQGLVQKINVGDNEEHYDADVSSHTHFYCDVCKSVIDIDTPCPDFKNLLSPDFTCNRHQLILYGRCEKCKNN